LEIQGNKKKMVMFVTVQAFDWLSRYLVYYLYMNECGCMVNN